MDDKALSALAGLTSGGPAQNSVKDRNSQIDKNEFIQLLVTQLKHQDPLDPMGNEDFAVQLAQFSQLEQLIGINEKLTKQDSAPDISSMASYLGHEVTLNTSSIKVDGGSGGKVAVELGQNVTSLKVELVDTFGTVRHTIELGAQSSGRHSIELDNLEIPDGDYKVQAKATTSDGSEIEPKALLAGIVNGFVPGPDPRLLVGNLEIYVSEIRSVHTA